MPLMKLRNPWLIRLLALLAAWLIRLWMHTLHYRMVFPDEAVHPADARRTRYIYAFWHETLLFPTRFPTRIHVLISQHADGEFIAQVCRHLRYGVVRGSRTRGGAPAVRQMVRLSRRSHLLVTPDGPRGPRRQVQPGLIYLASRTELPIIACGVGYTHAWRARSWDRFAVPRPWSEAVCVLAPAVHVPPGLDRAGLERYRLLIEERFRQATEAAERLAGRRAGRSPPAGADAGPAPPWRASAWLPLQRRGRLLSSRGPGASRPGPRGRGQTGSYPEVPG
jgi:lysophospholipid acyltransferase (LPLAT)-like uncharacterized protein